MTGDRGELLARLRADYPAWDISSNATGLGLWSAERHEGTALHYLVALSGEELRAKLDGTDNAA